jgi:hypothetical protein
MRIPTSEVKRLLHNVLSSSATAPPNLLLAPISGAFSFCEWECNNSYALWYARMNDAV